MQRAAAVKKLEAQRAAEAAAAAAASPPQRSEMWVSRRQSAALLTAAARRMVARGLYTQADGAWEMERVRYGAVAVLTAAVRRRQQQRRDEHRLIALQALGCFLKRAHPCERLQALRQAGERAQAMARRALASEVLEQRRFVARVIGVNVLAAALQRSVRRASFTSMVLCARACGAVIVPRIFAALATRRYGSMARAQRRLAAGLRGALLLRGEAHALRCKQQQAQRVLRGVWQRCAAHRQLQRYRAAVWQLGRAWLQAVQRSEFVRQCASATRLQAGVRRRLQSDKASLLMGEAAMERCSLRERRRKNQQRQPSWKKAVPSAGGDAADEPAQGACLVGLIWLPCFAADHVDGVGIGGRGDSGRSGRATACSSRGTRQGDDRSSVPLADGDVEQEEGQPYDEEVKLCMGHSVQIARPLSSHVRRVAPTEGRDGGEASGSALQRELSSTASTRPRTSGAEGRGVLARPMTSGGSRNADTTSGVEHTVKRWAAAASSIALIEDDDLARAAVSNIVHNQGEWVSEGMKCWLAHCIARRSARRQSMGAGEEKPWSRGSPPRSDMPPPGDESKEALQRAAGQIWPFIDEDSSSGKRSEASCAGADCLQPNAGYAAGLDEEAASSISARQRICSQLHVAYLCSLAGDHSKALKLCTAARKALSPVAAFLQRGQGTSGEDDHLPAWPSLLSCSWGSSSKSSGKPAQAASRSSADDSDDDDEDEGAALGGYVDCCPLVVLAVAQSNCAAGLLRMGAADQALQMALSARVTFAKAGALTGRDDSSGLAWEAHSEVSTGIDQILRAAQLANGVEVKALDQGRADVLQLTYDSDDEVPVASAKTAGTALFAKRESSGRCTLAEADFDLALGGGATAGVGSPFSGTNSLSTPQRGFATQPLGRLGAFGVDAGGGGGGGGGGALMGSARLSTSEVAAQVANLLDHAGTGQVRPAAAPSRRPEHPSLRTDCAVASSAPTLAQGDGGVVPGSASMPLSDLNGPGGRARFGQNGATWRLTHGTRPISASRHKKMGFNPEVGRHAPLLDPSKLLTPAESSLGDMDDL